VEQKGHATAANLAALKAIAHVEAAGKDIPFGVGAVDSHRPGGGLARGALQEVVRRAFLESLLVW
jgi:hypothetical protein